MSFWADFGRESEKTLTLKYFSDCRRKSNQLFHFEILIGLSKRNSAHFVACTTKPLILKFPSSFQLFNFSLDFKLQRNDIFRRNFPTSPGTIQLKWKRRMTSQNFNFSLNFELTLALIRNRLCLTIRNFVICNDCGKCRMAIFKNEKIQIGEWPNSKMAIHLKTSRSFSLAIRWSGPAS